MPESASKVPVKSSPKGGAAAQAGRSESVAHPLHALREQIDRLFDDFASHFSLLPRGRRLFDVEPLFRTPMSFGVTTPAVDVVEKDAEFVVSAELPGMDEKDIEVAVANDILTIKGEKKEEKEEKRKGYYMSERRYGSFQRSFRLPDGVKQDRIEASFEKGVLTVVLPKSEEAKTKQKKIAIKAK